MFRFAYISLWMLLSIYAEAQSPVNVTSGKSYPLIESTYQYTFRQGNTVMVVKRLGKKIYLQKLNATSLTVEKAMQYEGFPKSYEFEWIGQIGNTYYVFFSSEEKEGFSFKPWKIDFAKCELVEMIPLLGSDRATNKLAQGGAKDPNPNAITFDSFKNMNTSFVNWFEKNKSAARAGQQGRFAYLFSDDSSKFAIICRIKPEVANDSRSYEANSVWVFDANLQQQWSGRVDMPYTERKMNIIERGLDNKGNLYFLISVFKDETTLQKKSGEDSPNYILEILTVNSSQPAQSTKLDLHNKFIHSASFNDYQGEIKCSGYYSVEPKPEDVDGVFVATFANSPAETSAALYEIKLETINEGESKSAISKNARKEEKGEAEFPALKLVNTFLQPDGSLIIEGEQKFVVTSSVPMGGGGIGGPKVGTMSSFSYEHLLITKIKPDGTLAWMQKLLKQNEGLMGNSQCFAYLQGKENSLYYIFEGSAKEFEIEPGQPFKSGGKAVLGAYRINDLTGEVQKIWLADLKNINNERIYNFSPQRIVSLTNGNFLFEAEIRPIKEVQMVKTEFKEEVLVKVQMN